MNKIPLNNFENIKYHELFDMLVNFCELGKEVREITSTEELIIRNVAGSQTKAAIYAETILAQLGKERYDRVPESLVQDTSGNARLANIVEEISEQDVTVLKIIPNPITGYATIEYRLPKKYNSAEILVYNILGKRVKTITLNKEGKSISLNREEIGSGLFFINFIVDDKVIENKKFIVLK